MFIKQPGGWRLRLSGGALLVALTGCAGGNDDMNTDSMASSPPAAGSPPSMMLTADFDSIQANIFTPICAGCHGGANPAENLNLDAEHSYNDLVNVPSTEEPMLGRDTLHASPPRIVIGFTQELDIGGLNPAAVRLERITEADDGQSGTLVIPVSVAIPTHNARALLDAAAAEVGERLVTKFTVEAK